MKSTIRPKRPGTAETLQQAVNEAIQSLPTLFFEQHIEKKLKEQGVKPPEGFARKVADHLLSGNREPLSFPAAARGKQISLKISNSDIEKIFQQIERFSNEQLPAFIPAMTGKLSQSVLKDLKAKWPEENGLQEADLAGFRERMGLRWGTSLGQLRMLLTMVREWCHNLSLRESHRRKRKNKQTRKLLIRLLVRACQVTDEILCLLENGFADGAMARWRTLHEIAVVAAVILQYGNEITERYINHQAVESKRALDKYNASAPSLGYKPIPARAQEKIVRAYDHAMATYGKPFKSDYGWAAKHLTKDRPTFADLEAAAGRAEMRSHYQMGNDNVHAGIKSMYVRLGLLGDYEGLLAGRSNAGLTEPGQNAAHTLTQLAVLIGMSEPVFDDFVIADMLITLRNEIPRSFAKVDAQLKKEDREIRQASLPAKQVKRKRKS